MDLKNRNLNSQAELADEEIFKIQIVTLNSSGEVLTTTDMTDEITVITKALVNVSINNNINIV